MVPRSQNLLLRCLGNVSAVMTSQRKWHTRLDTAYFAEAKFHCAPEILTAQGAVTSLWGHGFYSLSPILSSRSCNRRSSSGEGGVRSCRSRYSSSRRTGRSCRAGWRAAMHRKVCPRSKVKCKICRGFWNLDCVCSITSQRSLSLFYTTYCL